MTKLQKMVALEARMLDARHRLTVARGPINGASARRLVMLNQGLARLRALRPFFHGVRYARLP